MLPTLIDDEHDNDGKREDDCNCLHDIRVRTGEHMRRKPVLMREHSFWNECDYECQARQVSPGDPLRRSHSAAVDPSMSIITADTTKIAWKITRGLISPITRTLRRMCRASIPWTRDAPGRQRRV